MSVGSSKTLLLFCTSCKYLNRYLATLLLVHLLNLSQVQSNVLPNKTISSNIVHNNTSKIDDISQKADENSYINSNYDYEDYYEDNLSAYTEEDLENVAVALDQSKYFMKTKPHSKKTHLLQKEKEEISEEATKNISVFKNNQNESQINAKDDIVTRASRLAFDFSTGFEESHFNSDSISIVPLNSGETTENSKENRAEEDSLMNIPGIPGVDYPIYEEIPTTGFECSKQRYKGFFADIKAQCQAWHYCDFQDGHSTFLCPNGTLFSQVLLTCDWWFNVNCHEAQQLYVLNERLYRYVKAPVPTFPEDYYGPEVDLWLKQQLQLGLLPKMTQIITDKKVINGK